MMSLDHNVTDRTLGVITSAPKGASHAHQQAQHATSIHGAARDAIYSLLGLHHVIRLGPPLGLQEASTTDMAREPPSQTLSL
ncbi:hypothetical protein V6N13_022876 [Hibiscus sabdariffa]